jgi:hypothetical protein
VATAVEFVVQRLQDPLHLRRTDVIASLGTRLDAVHAAADQRRFYSAPDVSADQIRAIQDVITSNVPFNPLRGDEIDICLTAFKAFESRHKGSAHEKKRASGADE